jgi:hypothetical protein
MANWPLLRLEEWDGLPSGEKSNLAEAVARSIVMPRIQFQGLRTCQFGQQEHNIATFISPEATFALLPGYSGWLGYDPNLHVLPDLPADIGDVLTGKPTLQGFLKKVLTPLREVQLAPILIATTATPLHVMERLPDGSMRPLVAIQRQEVLDTITKQGYRFPTSDEWEYACSGGSRTFFRWGDAWRPIDWHAEFRREPDDWREDLKPNGFGLEIGQVPWALEFCAEDGIVRGGDSGAATGSEAGWFYVWLGFATSYRYPFLSQWVNRLMRQAFLRQVISLPSDGSLTI